MPIFLAKCNEINKAKKKKQKVSTFSFALKIKFLVIEYKASIFRNQTHLNLNSGDFYSNRNSNCNSNLNKLTWSIVKCKYKLFKYKNMYIYKFTCVFYNISISIQTDIFAQLFKLFILFNLNKKQTNST